MQSHTLLAWLLGIRNANTRVPPIFLIGLVSIVAATASLALRGPSGANGVDPTAGSSAAALVATAPPGTSSTATSAASRTDASALPSTAGSAPVATSGTADPAAEPAAEPALSGYVWPLNNANITLPFGPSDWGEFIVDGQRFHDGVDMATNCGDQVHAAHEGTVLAASRVYDAYMGWTTDIAPYYKLLDTKHWWDSLPIVIVIDDGDGYRSIYAHEYQVLVKPGQKVEAGQVIGYEGATGNASGCHVHFGLFKVTETATFQLDPGIVSRDQMPAAEMARTDPLLVLPFRCEVEEMRALRPSEATECPALPTSKSSATPSKPPASAAPASGTPRPSDAPPAVP